MVINPIVGVYIPIIRILIKGGMTIPNIATFDHGTHGIYGIGKTGDIFPEKNVDENENLLSQWLTV